MYSVIFSTRVTDVSSHGISPDFTRINGWPPPRDAVTPWRRDAVPGGVRAMAAKLAKELGAKANLQDMGMDGSGASENAIVYWWLYVQPVKWNPIN